MFRSLFIGFLILSALTSKGVGIQIDQNTNIPAGNLLDIYNAAVAFAERQSGLSDTKRDGTLAGNSDRAVFSIEQLMRSAGNDSQLAGVLSDINGSSRNEQCKNARELIQPSCTGRIYSCGSDPSPPCCGNYR